MYVCVIAARESTPRRRRPEECGSRSVKALARARVLLFLLCTPWRRGEKKNKKIKRKQYGRRTHPSTDRPNRRRSTIPPRVRVGLSRENHYFFPAVEDRSSLSTTRRLRYLVVFFFFLSMTARLRLILTVVPTTTVCRRSQDPHRIPDRTTRYAAAGRPVGVVRAHHRVG